MKTITFKVDNDKDFKLLIKLAERLGITIKNTNFRNSQFTQFSIIIF